MSYLQLPKWGEKFVPKSTRETLIVEESHVDLANKTFTTYTRNIALSNIMVRAQAYDVIGF